MAPVGTVDEVVASLERLESTLPVSDGVHWFNRMYLEVTLAVRDYLAHHTQEAPRFLERLVVFFGNAYLPWTAPRLILPGWRWRGVRCSTRATIGGSRRFSSQRRA
ncbi:MAG: hypothetical protein E6G05_03950 [Actinobacteria bacterium]|nr:MAG: hypothetical protein E6G05_03950 [Actinomycetota bacterium]